jgi:hypothetical protein
VNLLSRNVRKYKEKAAAKYRQLQEEHKESRRKREANREHRALVAKHRTLVAKCERLNKTVVLWKDLRVQCTRDFYRRPESCEAEFGPKVAAAEVDLDNAVRDLNALADDMVPQAHATAPAEARYAEELPVLNGNADIVPSSVAHHLSPVENNAADDLPEAKVVAARTEATALARAGVSLAEAPTLVLPRRHYRAELRPVSVAVLPGVMREASRMARPSSPAEARASTSHDQDDEDHGYIGPDVMLTRTADDVQIRSQMEMPIATSA